jgi:hypothetical protein
MKHRLRKCMTFLTCMIMLISSITHGSSQTLSPNQQNSISVSLTTTIQSIRVKLITTNEINRLGIELMMSYNGFNKALKILDTTAKSGNVVLSDVALPNGQTRYSLNYKFICIFSNGTIVTHMVPSNVVFEKEEESSINSTGISIAFYYAWAELECLYTKAKAWYDK